ncbi:hypothetical protein OS493_012471 [Desmophyllum pertusum]|uniref:Uncharacterized protein n=1 Tax=Desmophyllum pertusum TaxID=174260 RepID=A0A9X0D3N4_9CNID|nr:hypothetical protein OS493_012471 [Desmophyllum pertusum]
MSQKESRNVRTTLLYTEAFDQEELDLLLKVLVSSDNENDEQMVSEKSRTVEETDDRDSRKDDDVYINEGEREQSDSHHVVVNEDSERGHANALENEDGERKDDARVSLQDLQLKEVKKRRFKLKKHEKKRILAGISEKPRKKKKIHFRERRKLVKTVHGVADKQAL